MLCFKTGLQRLQFVLFIYLFIYLFIFISSLFILRYKKNDNDKKKFTFRILHGFRQSFPGWPGIKPGAASYIDSSILNVIFLKKGNN